MRTTGTVSRTVSKMSTALALAAALTFCQAGEAAQGRSPGRPKTAAQAAVSAAPQEEGRIIVYYFHGNARCPSCLKIEKYTTEAVASAFSDPLKKGTVELNVVNVDEPGNRHFTGDYKLYTKSVVVSQVRGGTQKQWKNLEKVWTLLGDEAAFKEYVVSEVKAYR